MARKHIQPQNQTSPIVLDATGYLPYVLQRHQISATEEGIDENVRQHDIAVRRMWATETKKRGIEDYVRKTGKEAFRNAWECDADKKGLYSRVKWEMDKILEKRELDVVRRRQRLKELLLEDDQEYFCKTQSENQSPKTVKEQMLDRYKDILLRKECDRQKLVEEKRAQQFRQNCPELRELVSKNVAYLVTEERREQQQLEDELRMHRSMAEDLFAQTWRQDAEAKAEREREADRRKREKNLMCADVLKKQMAETFPERSSLIASEQQEAQLMAEQRRLLELEKEWEKAEKKLAQQRRKEELDDCLAKQLKRKAKEVQEDLLLDLFFLDKIIQVDNEQQRELEKKKALRKEQEEYLAYLGEELKRSEQFQKEVDKLFKEEVEKMWERREREWRADKEMREKMNKKMIKDLHEQVRNKIEKCRLTEEIKIAYDTEILKQVQVDKQLADEQERERRMKNIQNRGELLQQIKDREVEAAMSKERAKREQEQRKKEQEDYENLIEETLANTHIDHLHPYRKACMTCNKKLH